MKLYNLKAIDELIERYLKKGGEIHTVKEGVLGYGIMVLLGENLKFTVITEVYLNSQSSAHKIRMYNKLPKKYNNLI